MIDDPNPCGDAAWAAIRLQAAALAAPLAQAVFACVDQWRVCAGFDAGPITEERHLAAVAEFDRKLGIARELAVELRGHLAKAQLDALAKAGGFPESDGPPKRP